ncbi:MAG TPA: tail fiber domain-containing protein [Ignavibacteria bacterium]|nr:tail fiber domain-containing protein [Ignavibacteria bacterium]HMQ98117.1 tail fiber domain-containing protein [Ignavibacteria bacterium]
MKIIKTFFILSFFTYSAFTQHITNTLGSSGVFTIKDAGTTFLTLKQTDGLISIYSSINLSLTTSPESGIIKKGNQSFLHDFTGAGSIGGNIFLGIYSGNFTMTTAAYNTGIGEFSLNSLTTGSRNTAMGFRSLFKAASGTDNSAFGSGALYFNTTGSYNSAFGVGSLYSNATSGNNSAFGYNTLTSNIGSNNSGFGAFALYLNTTGSNNSTFGFNSLKHNSTGSYNSSFGTASMDENTTGSFNSSFGYWSLKENTTGNYNCGFGSQTLTNSTIGINNCAFGFGSMNLNISGSSNTALGHNSMIENVSGTGNTSVGAFSFTGNTTGQLNTVIGYQAGSNIVSGSNNTLIGYNTEPSSSTVSNQITLGNNSVTSLRCNVTTITSLSDRRDKKNIHDLNLGLGFISKLRPRIYNWDKREWYDNNTSDGSKMRSEPTAGFIAQELDSLQTSENAEWLNLVLKDNQEKWEATPGNLLPIMVKAIQELGQKCDSLKKENEELSAGILEVNDLKKMIDMLSTQIGKLNSRLVVLEVSACQSKSKENLLKVISNENPE